MKVRGAHSGFMRNGYVHTDSNVSCGRVMLLRAHGVEEHKDAATLARFAIGHRNEEVYCEQYLKDVPHERDVLLSTDTFEGHADVVTDDAVYELKSVTSPKVWSNAKAGKYKLSNLAQLVGYMIVGGRDAGWLCYTFYEGGEPKATVQFEVTFDVMAIHVNGAPTGYCKSDWWEHHFYMLRELNSVGPLHPDQPVDPSNNFGTPCTWCPFSSVCDSFNPWRGSKEEFIACARDAVKVPG